MTGTRTFDLVIKRGTIIDGLQTPRYRADIGIKDGRIVEISSNLPEKNASQVIDAQGKIVAPGFVDLHTHYDSQIFWDPWCTMSGWHGVTSVVIGNCGFGFAPCKPEDRERTMLSLVRNEAVPLETMRQGMPWDWVTFKEYLDSVERTPKGVNVMSFVPLAPLYGYVVGSDEAKRRPATDDELQQMCDLLIEGMEVGGCGISDGGAHTKFVTTGRYPTELLGYWVREHNIMTLEEAHWRLSALPAQAAGLKGRGSIAEHQVRQVDATQFLMVSGPRVAGFVSDSTAKFKIDTAVERISCEGRPACANSAVGRLFLSAQRTEAELVGSLGWPDAM